MPVNYIAEIMQYMHLYFSTSEFIGYIFLCSVLLKNEVKVFLECVYINQATWNVCFFISVPESKTDVV